MRTHPEVCKTLVIDTIDWAEAMCVQHICDKHRKNGIEDFGYGNGYVYVKEELGRFLNKLSEVVEANINVVLTAHAQIRKFEQPDELGAYDRWELKLGKKTSSQTSPLIKEWADMLLFANYKTFSVAIDDKGKKRKAQGGERVMYTSHHACWDAKNRYGLPEEVPFSYASIAQVIEEGKAGSSPVPVKTAAEEKKQEEPKPVVTAPEPVKQKEPMEQMTMPPTTESTPQKTEEKGYTEPDPRIPKALRDLMIKDQVDEWNVKSVCESKGYVPYGTELWEYDTVNPGIVDGLLVPCWQQVKAAIDAMLNSEEIPFN